jgi:hypothetical protein
MGMLIDRLESTPRGVLWLDSIDYAANLLAGGRAPWLDATALVAWFRKTQGLLGSDVVGLPLGALAQTWVGAHDELRVAMAARSPPLGIPSLAARSRTIYPLRILLADEMLRAHMVDVSRSLRACVGEALFALVLPSPRRAVAEAFALAFGADLNVEVGEDQADSASLYMADFLRIFGEAGADVLLLEESASGEPQSAAELACYQAVLNVAEHYRWDTGLRVSGTRYDGGESALSFVIAPRLLPGTRMGISVPASFWQGATAPACPAGGFRFSDIPPDAAPESVLERVALLR